MALLLFWVASMQKDILGFMQALRIVIGDEDLREELRKINSNSRLSELFLSLARDLDVMEPKSPEEVTALL